MHRFALVRRPLTRGALVALALGALLSGLVAMPAQAAGSTLTVGAGQVYTTIQAGVDAAASGDTVQVKDGTYTENVIINGLVAGGKAIKLIGNVANPANVKILEPLGGTKAMIYVYQTGSTPVEVAGFTLTGGNTQAGQGGGMTIERSSPNVHDNIIQNNNAPLGYGGGILINTDANPFIHDNIVSNNHSRDGGGGIFMIMNSAPVIVNNQITGNTTSGWVGDPGGGSTGGGIYMLNNPSNTAAYVQPVLLGNTITGNTAAFGGGGMVIGTGISALVQDNTISGNTGPYGGGIQIESVTSEPIIEGNRITGNNAPKIGTDAGVGGGIAVFNQSKPTISGNLITDNDAGQYGGGIAAAENSNSTITGNTIARNAADPLNQYPSADGGGLFVSQATVTVTDNLFDSNTSDLGGAMAFEGALFTTTIVHNTIVRNSTHGGFAGGIFVGHTPGSSVTIVNNLFSLNKAEAVYEEYSLARLDNNFFGANGTPGSFYYNTTAHTLTTAAALNSSGDVNATGNVDGNASFTNAGAGDFSITSASKAIGIATTAPGPAPDYVGLPAVPLDIRGVSRQPGPADAGAYEYAASPVVLSIPVLSGTPEVSQSLSVTPGTWGTAPTTISYQWLVSGTPVAGATGPSYLPRVADVGASITVTVSATSYGVYSKSKTVGPVGPVTRGAHFADVPAGSAFATQVDWMWMNNISTGTNNDPYAPLYKPLDAVSRQAMAAFLYRLSVDTAFTPPAEPTFADVPTTSPFYLQVEWMAAKGISTGTVQPTGKPLFKPTDVVTRVAMALFLARYAHIDVLTPPATPRFADVATSEFGAAAINWLWSSGISTGTAQSAGLPLFKPLDPVSRQAMAAFLYRLAHLP